MNPICEPVEVAPPEYATEDPLSSVSVNTMVEGFTNSALIEAEITNTSSEQMQVDITIDSNDGEVNVEETGQPLSPGQTVVISEEVNYSLTSEDSQHNVQACTEVTNGEWL